MIQRQRKRKIEFNTERMAQNRCRNIEKDGRKIRMTWQKLGGEDKGQIKATINEAIIDTRSP